MEKKNNKMTLEKLAEMTQKGFEELRGEMKNEIGGLRGEMKNEIGGLRGEMNEKFDSVLSGQDQILKRLEDLETDNTMDTAVHRRQEDKLENHEERIVVVEDKVLV